MTREIDSLSQRLYFLCQKLRQGTKLKKIALNTVTPPSSNFSLKIFHSSTENCFAYTFLQNAFLFVANMTAMSLVHELEDTSGNENDQPTGANNETLHQMAPRFTKPNIMTHAVIKPAGSTVHLSCPAEGEYIILLLKESEMRYCVVW
jgi:hypothetical protein